MAKVIQITNGSGSGSLINDNYTVSASVVGYENTSIDPSTLNVVSGTDSYAFTISASGTLTIHVTEDGTSTGIPIVGASFVRCDSSGNTYGSVITTDSNGDAVFNNVPYAKTDAPTIYFMETASDGQHEFINTVQNTSMTTSTSTLEIQNSVGATRTITLTDENYTNLPIGTATLTFTN